MLFWSEQIDEHVARALQEVENGVLTSSGNQNQSNDVSELPYIY